MKKKETPDYDLALFGGLFIGAASVGDFPFFLRIVCSIVAAAVYAAHCLTKSQWSVKRRIFSSILSVAICSLFVYELYVHKPESPPQIRVQQIYYVTDVGSQFLYNASFYNYGAESAQEVQWLQRSAIRKAKDYGYEDQLFSDLYAHIDHQTPFQMLSFDDNGVNNHGIAVPFWTSHTDRELADFTNGQTQIYMGLLIRYKDRTGRQMFTEYCRVASFGGAMGLCDKHNTYR